MLLLFGFQKFYHQLLFQTDHGEKIRELESKVVTLELKRVSDKQNASEKTQDAEKSHYKSSDATPSGSPNNRAGTSTNKFSKSIS